MKRLVAAIIGLALGGLAASRIDLRADVGLLLPEGQLRDALGTLRSFGGSDALIFEVGGSRDTLSADVAALATALEAVPGVVEVRAGFDMADGVMMMERLSPHAAAFVPHEQLEQRLSPEGMRRVLRRQLSRLAGPGGAGAEGPIRRDPLDLEGLALQHLQAASLPGVTLRDGLLGDEHHALVFAHSDGADVQAIDAAVASVGAPIHWYGGVRVAAETERAVRADVRWSSWLGVALLLIVLFVSFRTVKPVVAALPIAIAAASGVAIAAWLAGPIHPVQLGFAAALLGMAVDYWVHLICLASATAGPRGDNGAQALSKLLPALVVSAGSTVAAFSLLALSDEPIVRVLGVTGVGAIVAAVLGIWLFGPMLVRWVGPSSSLASSAAVSPVASPLKASAVVVVVCLAAIAARSVSFDGDPMHLLASTPELTRDQQALSERYGLTEARGIALVRGESLAQVRDTAGRVEEQLSALGMGPVSGPDRVLPSAATQASRQPILGSDLQRRIDAAAADIGFVGFPGAAKRIEEALSTPVSADLWQGTPLDARVDGHLLASPPSAIITVPAPHAFVVPAYGDTARAVSGVVWIGPSQLAEQSIERAMSAMMRGGLVAAPLLFVLLWVRYRSPGRAAAALSPAIAAALCAAGAVSALGMAYNPVGLAVMVLVIGLAVDYGVFTVESLGTEHVAASRRAVALSAATSVAGLAPLAFASSPALRVAGVVMVAGVCAAAATARWALPAVHQGWPSPRIRHALRRLAWLALVVFALDLGLLLWCSFDTPPAGPTPPYSLEITDSERRFGPNVLRRDEGVWLLRTQGDPWSVGYASGVLTSELRPRLEAELFDSFATAVPNPVFRWLIVRGSAIVGASLPSVIRPQDQLEIAGTAAPLTDTYHFSGSIYTRKLYYHAIHDLGQALVDTPLLGCTAFAAGGSATADGHWILARNFDFDGGIAFDRDKIIRVHSDDDSIPYLSVAFAGMVGAVSGVNAEGIAVSINASGADAPPRLGTPMTLIVREILQTAHDLDEVEAILRQRTGFVSENVLVVDGQAGESALFEVSPDAVVRVPGGSTISVSNHFRSPQFAQDQVNLDRMRDITTVPRLERMEQLVERHYGSIDLDISLDILSDRLGTDDVPLARGHRHAIDADIATHGFVVDATTRTVRVSRFPNLSGGFVQVSLDAVLAGDLELHSARQADGAQDAVSVRVAREQLRQASTAGSRQALALTEDALKGMPGHPQALLARAEALLAVGRRDEARELLFAAQRATPEYHHEALRIDELLRSMP